MTMDFEKYAKKGNEFLNRLATNLQTDDRAHAARILRSTLRVFRNHFSFEESLHLLSQLPLIIKGVYVDGWSLGEHKRLSSIDELVTEVVQEEKKSAWRDFGNREDVIEGMRAVIKTLKMYVSEEEVDEALGTLPLWAQVVLRED